MAALLVAAVATTACSSDDGLSCTLTGSLDASLIRYADGLEVGDMLKLELGDDIQQPMFALQDGSLQTISDNYDHNIAMVTTGQVSTATVLTSSLISNNTEDRLYDGWYMLNSSFSYAERIVIYGDVKLILKDGCTLTAQQGIRINTDATLTIYAQSETVGTMGKLVAIETRQQVCRRHRRRLR